ncbi:MAG: hypothetical protein ACLTYN_15720 [Dysosmobacter welbionis]
MDEGCPVTVTAEQLTFDVSGAETGTPDHPCESRLSDGESHRKSPSVQMLLPGRAPGTWTLVDVDSAVSSITADGQSLLHHPRETEDAAVDRFALTYTVEFPAWGTCEVA